MAAQAVVYDGYLSTSTDAPNPSPAGLEGTGGWADDFLITWKISSAGSNWLYEYWLTLNSEDPVSPGAISHWVVEISEDISDEELEDNFWDFKKDGVSFTTVEINDFDEGGSNPNMPGEMHGLKLDTGGTHFEFMSSRAPVWGDFYSKDGKVGQEWNAIWNADFDLDNDPDPTAPPQNGLLPKIGGGYHYKILRPDTTATPHPEVPEPTSIFLTSLGLAGLAFSKRFSSKP